MSRQAPERLEDAEEGSEFEQEQAYVSMLYARLDALRESAEERLDVVHAGPTVGNGQAWSEREAFEGLYAGRRAQLNAVERGLCFGRLDLESRERLYIGRIGLRDDDYEPVLVDWRAPAAQAFYRATPVERHGVVLRRHLYTRGRTVVGLDDDVLDLAAVSDADRPHLTGEAALLASLTRGRTGRMGDIVATIQAEQDTIIRSDLKGILVVEGGPGTGKTVVALHRAAYLLYTYRKQLTNRGILVVGPNATFLRYIDQVLPSLGETEVVLATMGTLFRGVTAGASERPEAAVVKGDPRMAEVIAQAVKDRQRVPEDRLEIAVDQDTYGLDPDIYVLDRATCEHARSRARRLREPYHGGPETHNRMRRVFVTAILDALTRQAAQRLGEDLLEEDDLAAIRRELRADPAVRRALDTLWPELTPQRLLADLLSSPDRLRSATPAFTDEERAALVRTGPAASTEWTPTDVPLLDEAAELLGPLDAEVYSEANQRARKAAEHAEDLLYAEQVIEKLRVDGAIAVAGDEVEAVAEFVVGGFDGNGPDRTLAERALEDREWTYGHVIVDEAQELSPMAWRMLMRRCPARSMTLVGDLDQTGAADGVSSWARVLDPHAAGRWRSEQLSVNYRTPKPIMAVAADVLAATDPAAVPPVSVRDTGDRPWAIGVGEPELAERLPGLVKRELAAIGDGRLAVIVPEPRASELAELIERVVPGAASGSSPALLDARVAILTPRQAKGLEFDAVLILDPAGIIAASGRGLADLYVALTRATRRLGVVHEGDLPGVLHRLSA